MFFNSALTNMEMHAYEIWSNFTQVDTYFLDKYGSLQKGTVFCSVELVQQ